MKENDAIKREELETIDSKLFYSSDLEDERRIGGGGYTKTINIDPTFSSGQSDYVLSLDLDNLPP